jgi:protein CpxP
MNSRLRNILYTFFVVLLAANTFTLARYWMNMGDKPSSRPESIQAFLVRELALDATQAEAYEGMIKQHRHMADSMRHEIRLAKEEMFGLLKDSSAGDSAWRAAALRASWLTATMDLQTMSHFSQLRAICRPEQQARFDVLLKDVARMMSSGPPPRHPGPPPGFPPPPER